MICTINIGEPGIASLLHLTSAKHFIIEIDF